MNLNLRYGDFVFIIVFFSGMIAKLVLELKWYFGYPLFFLVYFMAIIIFKNWWENE